MAERVLRSAPAVLPLLLRAGAGAIPGVPPLPIGEGVDGDPSQTTLVLDSGPADRDRLARYDRVCGFDVSDALPLTYPHVLAFGLQMTLLSSSAFPLPLPGLVHIANRIERRRTIDAGEPLQLRVSLAPIEPHPRGSSVTVATEARAGEDTVWAEWSTMLHRGTPPVGESAGAVAPPASLAAPPPGAELPAAAVWRLPGDLGRRYAAVSGDRNPIHLHALTAKPFGFARPLAHGMWTLARCLAALGPELPEAVTVEAAFRRPLLLPAVVAFAEAASDGSVIAFGVRDLADGTPHLDGVARQSPSGSVAAS